MSYVAFPVVYIDAHCHLADPRFGKDLRRVIEEAHARGIGRFVQGGVDPEDWDRQLALAKSFPNRIVTSFGLHPWWVASHTEAELEKALIALAVRLRDADALGELGLDHGPRGGPKTKRPLQEEAFYRQLAILPASGHKPLVLHVVQAHERALEILRGTTLRSRPGLVHSFSAGREIAKKYLNLGFYLSISGVVTRKGFETLKRTVPYIPPDRLVLETDAPDQSPEGWPRPCNEPVTLIHVADAVAGLRAKGVKPRSASEWLEQSAKNLRELFSL